jgi:hypothetical protein
MILAKNQRIENVEWCMPYTWEVTILSPDRMTNGFELDENSGLIGGTPIYIGMNSLLYVNGSIGSAHERSAPARGIHACLPKGHHETTLALTPRRGPAHSSE